MEARNRRHPELQARSDRRWLHIDSQSQFYDREAQPITRENALEHAAHELSHSVADNSAVQPINHSDKNGDQGISL